MGVVWECGLGKREKAANDMVHHNSLHMTNIHMHFIMHFKGFTSSEDLWYSVGLLQRSRMVGWVMLGQHMPDHVVV